MEGRTPLAQAIEKLEEAHLLSRCRLIAADKLHPTVELPARHEDVAFCSPRRPVEGAVVVGTIDQDAGAIGADDPPRIPGWLDDPRSCSCRHTHENAPFLALRGRHSPPASMGDR